MPVERFKYSIIVLGDFEADRKLVAENIEILKNAILLNLHVLFEKEPLNRLRGGVAMFEVLAIRQVANPFFVWTWHWH